MMKMGFMLISSTRFREPDASSEMYYLLKYKLQLTGVKVMPLSIQGLSLASMDTSSRDVFPLLIQEVEKDEDLLRHVLRLKLFDYYFKFDMTCLIEKASELLKRIPEGTGTWKIELNKRFTNVKRNDVITSIAQLRPDLKVNLENPDHTLLIEIAKDMVGIDLFNSNTEFKRTLRRSCLT